MTDYSCYVTIQNTTDQAMILKNHCAVDGRFLFPPPERVEPKSNASFHIIDDNTGANGTSGFISYSIGEGKTAVNISSHFSCPVWIESTLSATSSNPELYKVNAVTAGPGHPLFGTLTVTATPIHTLPRYLAMGIESKLQGGDVHTAESAEALIDILTSLKLAGLTTRKNGHGSGIGVGPKIVNEITASS